MRHALETHGYAPRETAPKFLPSAFMPRSKVVLRRHSESIPHAVPCRIPHLGYQFEGHIFSVSVWDEEAPIGFASEKVEFEGRVAVINDTPHEHYCEQECSHTVRRVPC